jgi:hypothetical protein
MTFSGQAPFNLRLEGRFIFRTATTGAPPRRDNRPAVHLRMRVPPRSRHDLERYGITERRLKPFQTAGGKTRGKLHQGEMRPHACALRPCHIWPTCWPPHDKSATRRRRRDPCLHAIAGRFCRLGWSCSTCSNLAATAGARPSVRWHRSARRPLALAQVFDPAHDATSRNRSHCVGVCLSTEDQPPSAWRRPGSIGRPAKANSAPFAAKG